MKIDLHMHSTVSDGTDTPAALLALLRESDIGIFSLTDHDDCLGCEMIESFLKPGDPLFIPGVELSAERDHKKYHILGYAYDSDSSELSALTRRVHEIRILKVRGQLEFLKSRYGITFTEDEVSKLLRLPNPGKPHVSRLMVKHGYVESIAEGIRDYLDLYHSDYRDITPEEAVETILKAGGIPVLAHGIFGDGRQHLTEEELRERTVELKELGLMGMECYYSGYSAQDEDITRRICSELSLLATAGSDYHGSNKTVMLGSHGLSEKEQDEAVDRFLSLCREKLSGKGME